MQIQDKGNKPTLGIGPELSFQESKYFTPSIEDIRVGYECEEILIDWSQFIDIFLPEGSTEEQYREAWGKFKCTDKYKSKPYILTAKDVIDFVDHVGGFLPERKGRPIEMYIRVPYLTKEQIEKEGWEASIISKDKSKEIRSDITYLKGKYGINFSSGLSEITKRLGKEIETIQTVIERTTSPSLRIFTVSQRYTGTYDRELFIGECKDINTFRYICKLLGI